MWSPLQPGLDLADTELTKYAADARVNAPSQNGGLVADTALSLEPTLDEKERQGTLDHGRAARSRSFGGDLVSLNRAAFAGKLVQMIVGVDDYPFDELPTVR